MVPIGTQIHPSIHLHWFVRQKTHILCMWHPSPVRLSSISSPWSLSQKGNILWLQRGEAAVTEARRSATGNTSSATLCNDVSRPAVVLLGFFNTYTGNTFEHAFWWHFCICFSEISWDWIRWCQRTCPCTIIFALSCFFWALLKI